VLPEERKKNPEEDTRRDKTEPKAQAQPRKLKSEAAVPQNQDPTKFPSCCWCCCYKANPQSESRGRFARDTTHRHR
jgi:hypothetical protein